MLRREARIGNAFSTVLRGVHSPQEIWPNDNSIQCVNLVHKIMQYILLSLVQRQIFPLIDIPTCNTQERHCATNAKQDMVRTNGLCFQPISISHPFCHLSFVEGATRIFPQDSFLIQGRPAAAAAAKSLQSCPTLCNPREGSPPGSPVPGILQARTLKWIAISFSNA